MENNVSMLVKKMQNTFISDNDKFDFMGKLLNKSQLYEYSGITGKVKLSPNVVVKANEAIYIDSTSKAYKSNQEASLYDVYTVILEENRDGQKKDLVNIWEKCYLASQLIGIIDYESN